MVKWTRNLHLRIVDFKKYIEYVKYESKTQLVLDCTTRWNSTYYMSQIAQPYDNVFDRYDLEDVESGNEIRKAKLEVPSWGTRKYIESYLTFLNIFMMLL